MDFVWLCLLLRLLTWFFQSLWKFWAAWNTPTNCSSYHHVVCQKSVVNIYRLSRYATFFCVWKTCASPTSKSSGTSFVLNPIEQFINWSPESMVQFNRNPLGYNGWDLMFVLGRFEFLSQTSLEHECQLDIKLLNRSQPPSTNFWHEPSGSNLLAQSSKILTLGFIRSPVYPAVWEESSKSLRWCKRLRWEFGDFSELTCLSYTYSHTSISKDMIIIVFIHKHTYDYIYTYKIKRNTCINKYCKEHTILETC